MILPHKIMTKALISLLVRAFVVCKGRRQVFLCRGPIAFEPKRRDAFINAYHRRGFSDKRCRLRRKCNPLNAIYNDQISLYS